jgi:hypothetical protein
MVSSKETQNAQKTQKDAETANDPQTGVIAKLRANPYREPAPEALVVFCVLLRFLRVLRLPGFGSLMGGSSSNLHTCTRLARSPYLVRCR